MRMLVKWKFWEKRNQHGNSFSCLFKWKDGLSLKWLCKSVNVFRMPVSFRNMLRLLDKAFPSLFGSVDFTKQLSLIMCQLWYLMCSPPFLAWSTAQWICLSFWFCDLALAQAFWRWISQTICNWYFIFFFWFILIEMDIINNFYAATSWSVRRSWICKCLSFGLVFSYSWLLWCWWNRVQTKPAQVRGLKQPLYKDWAADVGVGRGHGRSSMEEICRVRTCTEKEDREKLITLLIQELRGNKWTQEMAGLQMNWSRLVTQHVFQLWSFVMCSYEY